MSRRWWNQHQAQAAQQPQSQTAANAPAAAGVLTGDKVQIKFHDSGSAGSKEATERAGKKFNPLHWIYADVLEPLTDGALRVIVNHRGNILHGAEQIVPAGSYRAIADVAAAVETAKKDFAAKPSIASKDNLRGLMVQHARLLAAQKANAARK